VRTCANPSCGAASASNSSPALIWSTGSMRSAVRASPWATPSTPPSLGNAARSSSRVGAGSGAAGAAGAASVEPAGSVLPAPPLPTGGVGGARSLPLSLRLAGVSEAGSAWSEGPEAGSELPGAGSVAADPSPSQGDCPCAAAAAAAASAAASAAGSAVAAAVFMAGADGGAVVVAAAVTVLATSAASIAVSRLTAPLSASLWIAASTDGASKGKMWSRDCGISTSSSLDTALVTDEGRGGVYAVSEMRVKNPRKKKKKIGF
jgi:hypothetical protein